MKKILALLIVVLFVASLIPAAIAEDNGAAEGNTGAAESTGDEEVASTGEETDSGGSVNVKKIRTAKIAEVVSERTKAKIGGGSTLIKTEARIKNAQRIRERQKEQLMKAVELCREKGLDADKCEKKFEKRTELIKKLSDKDAERLEKINERKTEKLKELKNLKIKARAIQKEKLQNARERFAKAKENFAEARAKYKEAQAKFNETKTKLAECKDSETEECKQLQEEAKTRAKEILANTADRIIEHLNKIKAKAEENEDMTEEEASEIIAKIDEQITQIQNAKASAEAAETKEQVIEAAKTIRQAWLKIKNSIKAQAGRVVNARIGGIIVKSRQLEVKLERTLERLTEQGVDTSAIEGLIDDFNAKISQAKTSYESAVEKFKEAKAAEQPNSNLIKEAQGYLKDAHNSL